MPSLRFSEPCYHKFTFSRIRRIVDWFRLFEGSWCLYLQGPSAFEAGNCFRSYYQSTRRNILEDLSLYFHRVLEVCAYCWPLCWSGLKTFSWRIKRLRCMMSKYKSRIIRVLRMSDNEARNNLFWRPKSNTLEELSFLIRLKGSKICFIMRIREFQSIK